MTGSLFNHIMTTSVQPAIVLYQGATVLHWTDRSAGTIIQISENAKELIWQKDIAKRSDNNGMSESQTYEYTRNENGEIIVFTLRKNGRWIRKGQTMRNGTVLSIGHRSEYYDYSF